MELKKQPETEMEYWTIIEGLGGFAWRMNHDLADGRIEDKNGGIDKDIQEIQKTLARLVSELKDKFGVIPPNECPKIKSGEKQPRPPRGKKYYWDWYKKMKEIFYRIDYEKIICSACPLSKGLKSMISSGNIPCGPFRGVIYDLRAPYRCGMLNLDHWDEDRLRKEIIKKGGEVAFIRFKIKEAGLKALENPKTGEIQYN